MKQLILFSTNRALVAYKEQLQHTDGLKPALMSLESFYKQVVLMGQHSLIDPLYAGFLLRQLIDSQRLKERFFTKQYDRFYGKAKSFFGFFEELSVEQVEKEALFGADSYAEFEEEIEALFALKARYERALSDRGLIDRMMVPKIAKLNRALLERYDKILLHLDGYLSAYELDIFVQCSDYLQVEIIYKSDRFTAKMDRAFKALGVVLEHEGLYRIDLATRQIIAYEPNGATVEPKVLSASHRLEQIALAHEAIAQMIERGLAPEEIVLILPDEKLAEAFRVLDRQGNFNYAMGGSLLQQPRGLRALHLQRTIKQSHGEALEGVVGQEVAELIEQKSPIAQAAFIAHIKALGLIDQESNSGYFEQFNELLFRFERFMEDLRVDFTTWLFVWIEALRNTRVDDTHGGRVRVMGILESRGVHFKGVVIVDFSQAYLPAKVAKDQYLNSAVRAHANLPTAKDRENLQKHYYHQLLLGATESVVIYESNQSQDISPFALELGIVPQPPKALVSNLYFDDSMSLVEQEHLDALEVPFEPTGYLWSATMLDSYLSCKRRFYYRYILALKPPQEESENEGSVVHKLLQDMHQELPNATKEQMSEYIARYNLELPTLQEQIVRQKLSYYPEAMAQHFAMGYLPYAFEKEYSGEIGGLNFKGRIDRIDVDSAGGYLLIDYKTGKATNPTRGDCANITQLQMAIYERIFGQSCEAIYCLPYEKAPMERLKNPALLHSCLDEVVGQLRNTTILQTVRTTKAAHCTYCPYTLLCQRGDYDEL